MRYQRCSLLPTIKLEQNIGVMGMDIHLLTCPVGGAAGGSRVTLSSERTA